MQVVGEGWCHSTSSVEMRLGPGIASVQVCVCVHMYMYVHMHAQYMYMHTHVCAYMHMNTVHECMRMCMCVHVHMCTYVCACVSPGLRTTGQLGEESVITGKTVLLIDTYHSRALPVSCVIKSPQFQYVRFLYKIHPFLFGDTEMQSSAVAWPGFGLAGWLRAAGQANCTVSRHTFWWWKGSSRMTVCGRQGVGLQPNLGIPRAAAVGRRGSAWHALSG